MPNVIDNRVVDLVFNNKQFEEGVSTSLSTLDKLKNALNFSSSVSNFGEVTKTFTRFGDNTLNEVAANVQALTDRFSTWGIVGMEVIKDLTNKAIEFVNTALNPITSELGKIDMLTNYNAGWQKYADKTGAVQTIMSATATTWEKDAEAMGFAGSQMEYVDDALSKLNWFSDETSYSFTDMTNNIGKFTAQGVELSTAVEAMEGISVWAAKSGQGTNEAARAMYNLSQALGVGSVKLMDWRSVENANMGTLEFKNTVLETAVAAGTLKKALDKDGNAIYKTLAGTEVTASNFSQTLSEAWFSKDVLLSTLSKYGNATTMLADISAEYDVTASQFLQMMDYVSDGQRTMEEASEDLGIPLQDLSDIYDTLLSQEYELGLASFRMAQEAKTFSEAMDATADATSTAWMNVFESIFGNYEEAKKVWTTLANEMWDVVAGPVAALGETMAEWKEQGGRKDLLNGILSAWLNIKDAGKSIMETIHSMGFLNTTGEQLAENTARFRRNIEIFFKSDKWAKIVDTANGIVKVFGTAFYVVKNFFSAITGSVKVVKKSLDGLFKEFDPKSFFGSIEKSLWNVWSFIENRVKPFFERFATKAIIPVLMGVVNVFKSIGRLMSKIASTGAITDLVDFFGSLANKGLDKANSGIEWFFSTLIKGIDKVTDFVPTAVEFLRKHLPNLGGSLKTLFGGIKSIGKSAVDIVSKFFGLFKKDKSVTLADAISQMQEFAEGKTPEKLGFLGKVLDAVAKALSWIGNTLQNIGPVVSSVFGWILDKVKLIGPTIVKILGKIGEGIKFVFEKIKEFFANNGGFNLDNLFKIFQNGALSALLVELVKLFSGKGIGGISTGLTGIADAIKGFSKKTEETSGPDLKEIATAILMVAASCLILSLVDPDRLASVLTGLAGGITALVTAFALLDKTTNNTVGSEAKSPLSNLMDSFTNKNNRKSSANMILTLAGSLLLVAVTLKILGTMDWEQISVGLTAMGGALAMLIAAALIMEAAPNSKKSGSGLMLAALGMIELALALKILGTMSMDQISNALKVFTGSLLILTAALVILSAFGKNVIAGAAALLIATVPLLELVGVLFLLGQMKWEKTSRAVLALGIVLTELVAALGILSFFAGGALVGAAAIVVLSAGLLILVGVIAALGKMKWSTVSQGIGALALALVTLGGLGTLIGALSPLILLASVALLALGASMVTLGKGLAIFAAGMEAISLTGGLGKLAGTLAVLGAMGAVLAVLSPLLLVSSVGMLAFGAALVTLGKGLAIFAAAMAVWNVSMDVMMASIKYILVELIGLIPALFTALAKGVVQMVVVMAESAGTIASAVLTLLSTILSKLTELIPVVINLIGTLIAGILAKLAEFIPVVVDIVFDLLTQLVERFGEFAAFVVENLLILLQSILTSLAEHIGPITEQAVNIVTGFITGFLNGLANGLPQIIQAAWNLIISFVNGIADGINNNWGRLMEAFRNLFRAVVNAIKTTLTSAFPELMAKGAEIIAKIKKGISDKISSIKQSITEIVESIKRWFSEKWSEFVNAGSNVISGFIQGIKDKLAGVGEAIKGVATTAVSKIKGFFGIKSPSRVFAEIGRYTIEGLAVGMKDTTKVATDSAVDVGENVKSALELAMENASAIIENGEPVITPVVDMSNVNSSSRLISSMFGKTSAGSINVNGSARLASVASPTIGTVDNPAITDSTGNTIGVVNFTINSQPGQSPEEIADEVMDRINTTLLRGKAAWA